MFRFDATCSSDLEDWLCIEYDGGTHFSVDTSECAPILSDEDVKRLGKFMVDVLTYMKQREGE